MIKCCLREAFGVAREDPVVRLIGKERFRWLSKDFNESSTLRDIPDDILQTIASVDI